MRVLCRASTYHRAITLEWGRVSRENVRVAAKRLGIEPFAYLRDVIERVSSHPQSRIAELTPRGWQAAHAPHTTAR